MTITDVIIMLSRSKMFAFALFVASTYFGIHVLSHIDSRNASMGDQLHSTFSMVAIMEDGSAAFEFVRLPELETFLAANPGASFRLPRRAVEVSDSEDVVRSYQIVEEWGGEQLIEAVEKNDDYTAWSLYRSTNKTIVPVRSQLLHVAYMFRAAGLSLLLVILVQIAGKCLDVWHRRRSGHRAS